MLLDYAEGIAFRPPSEANSLLLRVTIGCSHNACTFCSMYRQVKFRTRSMEEIAYLIKQASLLHPNLRRVFLADGNALVLSTDKLLNIMAMLHDAFPKLSRITCYGAPKDIIRKSPDELIALKSAGLKMIYLGIESGDDEVLAAVNKGVTASEMVAAGQKVLKAGIKLSTMVILGLGGKARTEQHALNTAQVISDISPTHFNTLTLTLYDGTPLKEAAQRGDFVTLAPYETMLELKQMIKHINVTSPCILRSNHISNLLPLSGTLNRDKSLLLSDIDEVLSFLDK